MTNPHPEPPRTGMADVGPGPSVWDEDPPWLARLSSSVTENESSVPTPPIPTPRLPAMPVKPVPTKAVTTERVSEPEVEHVVRADGLSASDSAGIGTPVHVAANPPGRIKRPVRTVPVSFEPANVPMEPEIVKEPAPAIRPPDRVGPPRGPSHVGQPEFATDGDAGTRTGPRRGAGVALVGIACLAVAIAVLVAVPLHGRSTSIPSSFSTAPIGVNKPAAGTVGLPSSPGRPPGKTTGLSSTTTSVADGGGTGALVPGSPSRVSSHPATPPAEGPPVAQPPRSTVPPTPTAGPPSTKPPATSTPAAGGVSITGLSGKCLDVAGGSNASGTSVDLFACNGSTAQKWTAGSDGSLRALGKCLDAQDHGTGNGTRLQLWTCKGTANQVWKITPGHDLVNPVADRCADVKDAKTANGTALQLWDCTGGSNQKWFPQG